MNFRKPLLLAAAFALSAFSSQSAFAQESKVEAQKPKFDDLPSPEFSGGKQKSFKPKNWLEAEATIKLSMRPEPKSKTAERITVKWYVAVKNPEKSGTFLLLTKEIVHVNIPLDEDIISSVYLSPASLRRLTGSDRAGKGAVEYVGYEVLVDGEVKAADTDKGQPGWWKSTSDKISRTDTVPLLDKSETPFANMWWDAYAEIEPKRN
jgi:hypothetical protein